MSSVNGKRLEKREKTVVICIMIIATLSRLIGLGAFPGGMNVDEAFAGYEAWSLLHYGTDSWGIHNPVYLTVWGSGMSVLNTLLMIPFIKAGGLNAVTVRLPQAIVGIISVYVFYLLLKKLADKETAVIGMFLFAICPWHIMMSRFGMDCNLAPGMMLIAFYFFVAGLENEKYFIASAIFWGLSLYCYATIWIVVPILLICFGIYGFRYKKLRISKYVMIAVGVLFAMALPLLLFVAVNMGFIEPISGSILSVPRLVEFRSNELGLSNIKNNIKGIIRLLLFQNDGLIWNTIPYFGLYYLFTLPFIIIGFAHFLKGFWKNRREFCFEAMILMWVAVSAAVGILQGINANKINSIHIPVIVLWTAGVKWVLNRKIKWLSSVVIAAYILSFACFQGYYYTGYQEQISERQLAGAGESLDRALELQAEGYEKICVPNALRHSQVLFYTAWSLDNYLETVEWQNYPNKYLKTSSFGDFIWQTEEEAESGREELNEDMVYVILADWAEDFEKRGWNVEIYGYMGVAYVK